MDDTWKEEGGIAIMEMIMKEHITLDEYREIIEKVKAAALTDMESIGKSSSEDSERTPLSMLLLELKCRDPEDYEVERDEKVQLFTDFTSLKAGMFGAVEMLEEFGTHDFSEPLSDKVYWRVTRYTRFLGWMTEIYSVYFTVDGEIFSVEPNYDFSYYFAQYDDIVRKNIPVSPSLEYIFQNRKQLKLAWNVELPFKPGDEVYVDVRPFKAPFSTVYQGSVRRSEPYIYFYENFELLGYNIDGRDSLEEDIFPHVPYERMKLMKHSEDTSEETDEN